MYIKNLFDNYKQNVDPTSIQHDASNPAYSVWLNASAGTGKTKVLIDRVLRLLLSNVDISEILAITFTNAAAFEMKDRIMQTLQSWVLMSDSEIKDALNNLYGTEFDNKNDNEKQKEVIKAKSLFIKILDSPHGLRIETIHAFCQFILKKFPIESGINPNFSILTPHDADDILLNLYKNLIIKHGKKYSNIFDILLKYKDEETLFSAIKSIISVRKKFNKLFVKYDISIDDLD